MAGLDYPREICADCGDKHGRLPWRIATWYPGTCDICGKETTVSEPRDCGHLNESWMEAKNGN